MIDLSSLDGTTGFRLDGTAATDVSGRAVSGAGDVNGDGFDDLIVGADLADPNGNSGAGSSYIVLFGRSSAFASVIALSSLDGGRAVFGWTARWLRTSPAFRSAAPAT